jgi:hypothetical protein
MSRRAVRLLLLAVAAAALAVVGVVVAGGMGTSPRPDAPTVDGIVVGVDATGLANVTAFRLLTDDGRTLQFGLRSLRDPVQFPPGHLAEHVANSVRVRVWYRDDGGQLEALWLEDAPAS